MSTIIMLEQHKTCSERINCINVPVDTVHWWAVAHNVPVDTVHWWAVAHNYILHFIIVLTRSESAAFQNGLYFLFIINP